MTVLLLLPLVVSVLLAAATAALRTDTLCRLAAVMAAGAVLASGVGLCAAILGGHTPTVGGLLRADALSAFMLAVVGAVGVTATWGGLTTSSGRPHNWAYSTLVSLFLGSMSLAVLSDNLGVLWVAVEATTIATAFLVGHHRTRNSLEAAWKYVVLGSVGVAIAFLGLVLLYAATVVAGRPTLSWVVLTQGDLPLDPALLKVAAALAVLGFATKAGLAPMHSWLPDAFSQAPAPVAGLMSGVLESVAFYAILRVQAVVDPVLGPTLVRSMLLTAGLMSLTVAAVLVLRQRDLKRMLAYSSIEHMGLLALAAAVGGTVALAAALLHVLGHGLAKSSLFLVSGRILAAEGTTQIDGIRGLLVTRPATAIAHLAGMAALLGLPPFSLFFSEVAIVVAGFARGLGWAMAAAVVLLLVLFAGLARHTIAMTLGPAQPTPSTPTPTPPPTSTLTSTSTPAAPAGSTAAVRTSADQGTHGPLAPLVLALGATAVIAFIGPLSDLLVRAADVLAGAR